MYMKLQRLQCLEDSVWQIGLQRLAEKEVFVSIVFNVPYMKRTKTKHFPHFYFFSFETFRW